MQSHREAEEAPWLALLSQGAHHIQIEGDSPWGEQSEEQGTKKVTNPGDLHRIAARNAGHGTSPRALRTQENLLKPQAPGIHGVSLVSNLAGLQGSPNLSPLRRPTPAGKTAATAAWRPLGLPPPPPGHRPAPPSARPLSTAGGGRAASLGDTQAGGLATRHPSPTQAPPCRPLCALRLTPDWLPSERRVEAAPGNGERERSTERKEPKKRKGGKT